MRTASRDRLVGIAVIACAITAGVAAVAGAPYVAGATLAASLLADTKPWRRSAKDRVGAAAGGLSAPPR